MKKKIPWVSLNEIWGIRISPMNRKFGLIPPINITLQILSKTVKTIPQPIRQIKNNHSNKFHWWNQHFLSCPFYFPYIVTMWKISYLFRFVLLMEKETVFLIIFHMVIFNKKRYDFYIFLRGHEASHLVIVENRLSGNRLNKEKYRFLVVLTVENLEDGFNIFD